MGMGTTWIRKVLSHNHTVFCYLHSHFIKADSEMSGFSDISEKSWGEAADKNLPFNFLHWKQSAREVQRAESSRFIFCKQDHFFNKQECVGSYQLR